MLGKVAIGTVVCVLIAVGAISAQQVEVPREKAGKIIQPTKQPTAPPLVEVHPKTVALAERSNLSASRLSLEQMRQAGALAAQKVKEENHDIETDSSTADLAAPQLKKQISANAVRAVDRQSDESGPPPPAQSMSFSSQTAFTRLADGFDFPVGKPDARGYYKARGQGWGNVVIVRHAYREGSVVRNVDSLYGHLDKILVRRGQAVRRGQQVGTMGTAHGLYDSHLHLEVRKNIAIGMSRDKFAQDFTNYYDPSEFIVSHRHLQSSGASYRVAMNTFTYDSRIQWDKLHNYSHAHTGGGSSESADALKKALAAQSENAH